MRPLYVPTLLLALVALVAALDLPLAAETAKAPGDATPTVFYFHGAQRCSTCRSIERAADTVLHQRFAEALDAGDIAWKVVNFDEQENRHYVKDLSLAGSGVVIALVTPTGEVRDPKVQDVWRFSRDESRMHQYLTSEIAEYLGSER